MKYLLALPQQLHRLNNQQHVESIKEFAENVDIFSCRYLAKKPFVVAK